MKNLCLLESALLFLAEKQNHRISPVVRGRHKGKTTAYFPCYTPLFWGYK